MYPSIFRAIVLVFLLPGIVMCDSTEQMAEQILEESGIDHLAIVRKSLAVLVRGWGFAAMQAVVHVQEEQFAEQFAPFGLLTPLDERLHPWRYRAFPGRFECQTHLVDVPFGGQRQQTTG